ncbi:hypothetical protein [Glaciihabitans sp. UYNi722]|uniref:hypothetical protein n=1 Tax=Glaciihabitans sp. UYNi722 TaxID=3156344 RepID=UPI003394CF98
MQQLLYVLPVVVCPIVMGLVIWFMMRGTAQGHQQKPTSELEQELVKLRAEVNALRPVAAPFDERHPVSTLDATKPA